MEEFPDRLDVSLIDPRKTKSVAGIIRDSNRFPEVAKVNAAPNSPKPAKLANMEIGNFFVQNMYTLVMVAVVLGLLLFVMLKRGKRDREPLDF